MIRSFSAGLVMATATLICSSASAQVLYSQEYLSTDPAMGCSGDDASLDTSGAWGYNCAGVNVVRDDFTVPSGGWTIDSLLVYAYATGSGPIQPITECRVEIYSGDPTMGGTVVWGDMTTNVINLGRSSYMGVYRAPATMPLDSCARPINEIAVDVGVTLPAGQYWVSFNVTTTAGSGPWMPTNPTTNPMAPDGTGCYSNNALLAESMPFVIEGSAGNGPIGSNYCTAVANSSGSAGTMSGSGSNVAASNNVTVTASNLPANQFGIFVTSLDQGFVPGGNGTSNGNICLGGVIGRYTAPSQILSTGAGGTFSLPIDLTAVPQGNGTVMVMSGQSWNYQAWHRDGVGLGSNFTDGLEIMFQ